MPRTKKTNAAKQALLKTSASKVTVSKDSVNSGSFLDKIQSDLEKNQSYLNLILGALIVIVLGVLIYNYFNKPADPGDLGPSSQMTDEQGDVTKESLPGSYMVKEGDTLFLIAQKYYGDGYKYPEIIKENSLPGENIDVGQKLNIPKLESEESEEFASPEASAESLQITTSPSPKASVSEVPAPAGGKGGAINQTTWGQSITQASYTVAKGDWLSTIAGRAYGDIMQYEKIAKANNISDPNVIEVGTVLKIPRN